LIDMPDLEWQAARFGGVLGNDLTGVLAQLEAGLAKLRPARQPPLRLGALYVYSPLGAADRPRGAERAVIKQRTNGVGGQCSACYKQCTHCRAASPVSTARGLDNPIAKDLLELARKDEYDWAIVVSIDRLLIPVVRYIQSRGRKIIHACFPPIAADLTEECWDSIDLAGIWDGTAGWGRPGAEGGGADGGGGSDAG
jgi:hypothetical protein